jgi:hypothetical protein
MAVIWMTHVIREWPTFSQECDVSRELKKISYQEFFQAYTSDNVVSARLGEVTDVLGKYLLQPHTKLQEGNGFTNRVI